MFTFQMMAAINLTLLVIHADSANESDNSITYTEDEELIKYIENTSISETVPNLNNNYLMHQLRRHNGLHLISQYLPVTEEMLFWCWKKNASDYESVQVAIRMIVSGVTSDGVQSKQKVLKVRNIENIDCEYQSLNLFHPRGAQCPQNHSQSIVKIECREFPQIMQFNKLFFWYEVWMIRQDQELERMLVSEARTFIWGLYGSPQLVESWRFTDNDQWLDAIRDTELMEATLSPLE